MILNINQMTGLDNGLDIVSQVVEDGGRTNHGDPGGIQFLFFSMKCEVKWALGSITTNKLVEVMEFQLSYSKS